MKTLDAIALTIWWCEGAKARRDFRWKSAYLYPVEVTNTEPEIIKIFVDFLSRAFGIKSSTLRGQLQIHKGDDQKELESFWSEQTGIPLTRFNKTIVRAKGKRNKKTKGTFKVRYYDKQTFLQLQEMLHRIV